MKKSEYPEEWPTKYKMKYLWICRFFGHKVWGPRIKDGHSMCGRCHLSLSGLKNKKWGK